MMDASRDHAPSDGGPRTDGGAHTPGPWERDRHGSLRGSNGKPVVAYDTGVSLRMSSPDAEDRANGHLIGAAPDLLEAAKALDAYWTEWRPGGPETDDSDQLVQIADSTRVLWRQCRAAIAKALGTSTASPAEQSDQTRDEP